MPFASAAAQALMDLLFLNDDYANIGDATGLQGSAAAGSLYLSLHTADPGAGGNQASSEAAYTGYARVAVARGAGFEQNGAGGIQPAATVTFPECGVTGATITHVGIGLSLSGAGTLLYRIALSEDLVVSQNITPKINAGELDIALATT